MHELMLAVANEHRDERTFEAASYFHVQSNNRGSLKQLNPERIDCPLSLEQVSILEHKSYEFGGFFVEGSDGKCSASGRLPSAEAFGATQEPMKRGLFEALFFQSFGETRQASRRFRPYPSGGAQYSAQVVVYCKNVADTIGGSYHYHPERNGFEKLAAPDDKEILRLLSLRPDNPLSNFDFVVLYSFLATVPISKYGYRGYRLGLLEIGSMYQKLLETLECNGCHGRIWGGFSDEPLSVALGVDPRVSWPVICQIAGRVQA